MKLSTLVRDCLYLNWALPFDALPPAPNGLEYETLGEAAAGAGGDGADRRVVLASAMLFRQQGTRVEGFPLIRLSYPQLSLRLYVRDAEGVAAVLFRRMWVPAWMVPGGWLLQQPFDAARFAYPAPELPSAPGPRQWQVRDRGVLSVEATPGAPLAALGAGTGPSFPSWDAAVAYFRQRPRGYAEVRGALRRIDSPYEPVEVVPVAATVGETSLLEGALGLRPWPALHSAFLCPEIPRIFEIAGLRLPAPLPQPVAVAADPAMRIRTMHAGPGTDVQRAAA